MSRWTTEYEKGHPGVHINYLPVGSGAGIAQVLRGMLDFGATDAPLTDQQVSQEQVKVMYVPVVLGADVAAYNVLGLAAELKFTPQILADIFLGKITRWNDSAIVAANRGIALPPSRNHRKSGCATSELIQTCSSNERHFAFQSRESSCISADSVPPDAADRPTSGSHACRTLANGLVLAWLWPKEIMFRSS
jgi:ABC-type phosphate transport system substrate-binding protein